MAACHLASRRRTRRLLRSCLGQRFPALCQGQRTLRNMSRKLENHGNGSNSTDLSKYPENDNVLAGRGDAKPPAPAQSAQPLSPIVPAFVSSQGPAGPESQLMSRSEPTEVTRMCEQRPLKSTTPQVPVQPARAFRKPCVSKHVPQKQPDDQDAGTKACETPGSSPRLQHGGNSSTPLRGVGEVPDQLRTNQEGNDLHGSRGGRSLLDKMVHGTPRGIGKAGTRGFSTFRGAVCDPRRGNGSDAGQGREGQRARAQSLNGRSQGRKPGAQAKGPSHFRSSSRGRPMGHGRMPGAIRSRGPSPSGPLFARTHGADGACCPAPGIQESVKQLQQLQSECQEVKAKLMDHQGNFECPKLLNPEPEVLACTESPATVCQTTPFISPLRQTLEQSQLPDSLENTSQKVGAACWEAFRGAEEAAWEVFQDSMLTYGFPQEPQLDLLEIYAYPDSRLTACVQESGGKAMRFTKLDGDLSTAIGQKKLWDLMQRTQPRHIWVAPECKAWCSWTAFNASRSARTFDRIQDMRQADQVHLRLCARICQWQLDQGRHFHMEQPELSKMLSENALTPVIGATQKVVIDMCVFGLKTPVTHRPIRKRSVILTTCQNLASALEPRRCPGNHEHQQIAGSLSLRNGSRVAASQLAGSYCRGFAMHVSRCLLEDAACVANEGDSHKVPFRRRVRFKGRDGFPKGRPSEGVAQKRALEGTLEGDTRGSPQARIFPASAAPSSQELSSEVWKPVFESAKTWAPARGSMLIPEDEGIMPLIRSRLPEIEILQAFVGTKNRTLCSPVGALPATTAPYRVTLVQRRNHKFMCLGTDDRTQMRPERKYAPITLSDVMITLFARPKDNPAVPVPVQSIPEAEAETSVPPSVEPQGVPSSPTIEQPPSGLVTGWAPPPTPIHGPAFRALSREEQSVVTRAHKNLGHPSPLDLSRHLSAAKLDKRIVQAALDYQCDACLESTAPRHQRPSKLHEPTDFNDIIGIDGFYFQSRAGYRGYVLHVLDESSCFHVARRATSRHASEATRFLEDMWLSWAGNPKRIYMDPAGELRSDEWLHYLQAMDCQVYLTASAWQRGRIERHGDILKHMLARLDTERAIHDQASFDTALLQCCQAKNALVRHFGYSPEQIVLGKSIRVPGSNSSDEQATSHTLAEGGDLESEKHRQRLDLRTKARQAFLEADNNQAIRRAILRRSNPMRGPFTAGDWVLYWVPKKSPNRLAAGRWHGPSRVICTEGLSTVWVSHGPKIIRCAPEHLRPASMREWQTVQQTAQLEPSLGIQRVGGASSFIDLQAQSVGSVPAPMPVANLQVPG